MNAVLRNLGNLLIILSFFLLAPIAISLYYGENFLLFMITLIIALGAGIFLRKKFDDGILDLTKGLILATTSYILFSVIGAIPYRAALTTTNSLFESVSGFTTTGLTTINDLSEIPRSILFWRAETQWIGGIGIVLLFLFIITYLSRPKKTDEYSASIETSSSLYKAAGFTEKIDSTVKKTTKRVINIYILYTAIGIVLLAVSGIPLYESVTLSMTSISTGGFTANDISGYNNWALAVLCIMMILGSTSFFMHDKLLRGKMMYFLKKAETRTFASLIAISVLAALPFIKDVKIIIFQLISAFTTTGYSLTQINTLPAILIALICAGMFIGGNIASTAGGIKIFRFYVLVKAVPWIIKKISTPVTAIVPFKIEEGKVMDEEDIILTQILFSTFMFAIALATMTLMLLGHGFLDSAFQTISAIGTVGLQTMDIAASGALAKTALIACMILGRLEIFPVLVLLRRLFTR